MSNDMKNLLDKLSLIQEDVEADNYYPGPDEPGIFKETLLLRLQERYPEAKFRIRESNDRVESDDGKLTVIASEFVFHDLGYVGVEVNDVATGPYTGVLANVIHEVIEQLGNKYPYLEKSLLVIDDENYDAWEYIANKFGYNLLHDYDIED